MERILKVITALTIVTLLVVTGWALGLIKPKDVKRATWTVTDSIKQLVPLDLERKAIERQLSKMLLPKQSLPVPLLYWEKGKPGTKGRYLVLGTMESMVEDTLKLRARETNSFKVDNDTIFACIEFANKDRQLKDYTRLYLDFPQFVPHEVNAEYLRSVMNLTVFPASKVGNMIVKNSWTYVFIPTEKWGNEKTASLVIFTYCY